MNTIDRAFVSSFQSLEMLAKEVVQGFMTGLHKSPFHGFSVEFAEHRQYNTGEATKHIDWKLYGRTERLYVKQYEEETNLRANFILDTSSSMFYPRDGKILSKFEYSVYATAVLMQLLQKQRDAYALTTFDEVVQLETAFKSTGTHYQFILNELTHLLNRSIPEQSESNLAAVLHQKAELLPKRSMVVLFTDFFQNHDNLEAIWEAFRHLNHNQHDVVVFQVGEQKTESALEFDNKQTKFVDTETGEMIKINPSQIQDLYQKKMQSFYKEVKNELTQLKVDFYEVDVNQSFNHIIRAYLARRKKFLQTKR